MWQSWAERSSAMNSLGRKRISKAQLIYNTDRNMKSSCVSEPELINSAMGEKRAKTILLTSWKTCGNEDEDTHCLGETKTAIKLSKESTSRTRKDSSGW